ncbi:MAG: hypothetical protein CL608_17270 [Anaerolineaceae bacterium]|nr:hypothetical protein [Anaerolineaceae bacterium]
MSQNNRADQSLGFQIPSLSYSVPEPTTYTGVNIIQLKLPVHYFNRNVAPDYALSFNGTGSNVHIPDLGLSGNAFMFEAWVNGTGTVAVGDRFYLGLDGKKIRLSMNGNVAEASLAAAPHTWVHIAAVLDSDNDLMAIYCDGKQFYRSGLAIGFSAPKALRIGGNEAKPYFRGMIDEVRLWQGTRTEQQIESGMAQDVSMVDGLAAYWRFDEGSGNQVNDHSGNGRNGTIYGAEWGASTRPLQGSTAQISPQTINEEKLRAAWQQAVNDGIFDSAIFPGLSWIRAANDRQAAKETLATLQEDVVVNKYQNGERLSLYRTVSGKLSYRFEPFESGYTPSLYLIERYRLSSFLGNYGAGRIIRTFSLLPGEKTKIRLSSYTETKREAAQSIFDSYTQSSANEFQSSLESEWSSETTDTRSRAFQQDSEMSTHVEASLEAGWGFGSASVSAEMSASMSQSSSRASSSTRNEFARNVSNAVSKHAAQASSQRDVSIMSSAEVTEGESSTVEREIENVNKSRTLNFVFRQMNQEYFSILHLIDVRVAVSGHGPVALSGLDQLLATSIKEEFRDGVRQVVEAELQGITGYDGKMQPDFFLQGERLSPGDNGAAVEEPYLRVNHEFSMSYRDPITNYGIQVPGVILNVQKIVMRTDGVMVEAMPGQSLALDEHTYALQAAEAKAKRLENRFKALRLKILEDGDAERAGLFQQLFAEEAVA